MKLEELKRNMSVLEHTLSETSTDIKVNIKTAETAQSRILKKYRYAFTNCLVIAVVFCCLWLGNVSPEKLPNLYKAFIAIMCAVAAVWYIFLFIRLKNIKISLLTPVSLFTETTKIKILTLSGEVVFGLALAVFFTLLLSEMLVVNRLVFWLIVGILIAGLVWSIIYVWPRYVKLFRELNAAKD